MFAPKANFSIFKEQNQKNKKNAQRGRQPPAVFATSTHFQYSPIPNPAPASQPPTGGSAARGVGRLACSIAKRKPLRPEGNLVSHWAETSLAKNTRLIWRGDGQARTPDRKPSPMTGKPWPGTQHGEHTPRQGNTPRFARCAAEGVPEHGALPRFRAPADPAQATAGKAPPPKTHRSQKAPRLATPATGKGRPSPPKYVFRPRKRR